MSKIGSPEITGEFFKPVVTNAKYNELKELKDANIRTEAHNAIIFSVPYNEASKDDISDEGSIWLTDMNGYLYCISKPYKFLTESFVSNETANKNFDKLTLNVDTLLANQNNFVTNDNLSANDYASKAEVNEIVNVITANKLRDLINGAPEQYDTIKELADSLETAYRNIDEIRNALLLKANNEETYNSGEIDSKIATLDVYTRSEIDRKIAYLEELIRRAGSSQGGGSEEGGESGSSSTQPQVKHYYWYIGQTYPNAGSQIVFENNVGWRYIGTSTEGYEYIATGYSTIESVDHKWGTWYIALPKESNLSIFDIEENIDYYNNFELIGTLLYNNVQYNVIKLHEAYDFYGWHIKNRQEDDIAPIITLAWCATQSIPDDNSNWIEIGKSAKGYNYKAIGDKVINGSGSNTWYVALPEESNLTIYNTTNNLDFYNAFINRSKIKHNYIKYNVFKMFNSETFENWEIKNKTESSPNINFYFYIAQNLPNNTDFEDGTRIVTNPNDLTAPKTGWYPIDDICDFIYDFREHEINITKIDTRYGSAPWYVALPIDTDLEITNCIGEEQYFVPENTEEIIVFRNIKYKIIKFNYNGPSAYESTGQYSIQNYGKFKGWVITNRGKDFN